MIKKYISLDTETTGLYPEKGDRIIEIACIKIKNNKITKKIFHKYINPERKISFQSFLIHKIPDKKLKEKPKFIQIYKSFKRFIKGSYLIIHNADFDKKFILNEFNIINKKIKLKIIDTLKIARKLFPRKKNSLEKLAERLNIKINQPLHNAKNDAITLAKIFISLKKNQWSLPIFKTIKKIKVTNKIKGNTTRKGSLK